MAVVAAGVLLAAAPVTHAQIALKSPMWLELSVQEREILAPLASDWDKFDAARKAKWRGIAQRYPTMTTEQQQRVRQQMGTWAQLTPAERATAREQYKSMRTLPPEKKVEMRQQWERYQNLPPERKQELANRPPPTVMPPSQPRNTRPIPPPPPSAPPPGYGPPPRGK